MKFKIKYLSFLFSLNLFCFLLKAQDAQFSQYFNNPLYLSPAFTGLTDEHRGILNYRNQWLGLSKAFQTIHLSYDYNFEDKKNGVGVFLFRDMAGSSRLNTSNVGASYAYDFKLKNELEIRSGVQVNYVTKTVNTANLIFNDQLIPNAPSVSADANTQFSKHSYLDIAAGAMVNTLSYWAGISVAHVNRPTTSDLSEDSKLPMQISIHGAYKFIQSKKGNTLLKYISPTFNYRMQGNFDQLDVGVLYVNVPINLGIGYRGLPVKKYLPTYSNNDAISFLVGMDIKEHKMRVAYSYDLSISRLIGSSTGSHELSLIYELSKRAEKARKTITTGPTF
jgi:type IX secretion system PorP/SprF family membrane protein